MDSQIKENLTAGATWRRGFFMVLFALFYCVAEFVLTAVVVFQFGAKLFTGKVNRRLLNLGQSLATYVYQIILFLSFKSDDRPYPFDVWPKGAPAGTRAAPARAQPEEAPKEPASPGEGGEAEAKEP